MLELKEIQELYENGIGIFEIRYMRSFSVYMKHENQIHYLDVNLPDTYPYK